MKCVGSPSVKRANVEKSAPNHPGKPLQPPPPPLRAMSIWKQHISIRGLPKLGEAIRANRNSAFASILEALQVDYLKYLFI